MHWSGSGTVQTLPNGIRVLCQTRFELQHFYDDIFEREVYVKNGITLPDDACVLDVGANIGLFTIFIQERWPDAMVYSFEPAPPLFELLQKNVARYGSSVRCFNFGLSNQEGRASFTFYPNSSGMSSFYADREEEKETLISIFENEAQKGSPEVTNLMSHMEDYLAMRLEAQAYECQISTLSKVLRENGIERVDLLKIDAQKSEWDILQGLAEEDWHKVRQMVLEIHDFEDRLARTVEILTRRGYAVATEQDELYQGSKMYNLYAIRPPLT